MIERVKYKWTTESTHEFHLPEYNGKPQTIYCKKEHRPLAEITPDGKLFVYKGYSWDGCTPKFEVFGKVVGVWDGKTTYENRQQMYYPSLVHDVLCQIYNDQHGMNFYTRKDIDIIFHNEMTHPKLDINIFHNYLYYFGVRAYALVMGLK